MGLRPPDIDGVDRVCCGSRTEQCDDCPMKDWHELNLAEQEYRRVKADRKAHPDAVQRAWERYTAAARNLPAAKVRM